MCGQSTIRFMPPLMITNADVDEALTILAASLDEVLANDKKIPALLGLLTLCVADVSLAARVPVLRQVDLPHSYYYREMFLPQLTSGPSSVAFSPDGQSVVYSMGGSLWRQAIDGDAADELTLRPGLRLSTRLVARRTLHRVRAASRRCDRAVATGPGQPQDAAIDADEGRAASAAVFAGRRPHRVRVHGGQRPLQSLRRGRSTGRTRCAARRHRAAREHDRALLLLDARSRDQSVVDAGWQEPGVRLQSRECLRHGTDLQHRARGGRRAVVLHRRGDELARESGSGSRRPACAVQRLSRPAMASAVGVDAQGRSHAAADVRRVRRHAGALVAGRPPRRVHQQRDRAIVALWIREFTGGARKQVDGEHPPLRATDVPAHDRAAR